MSNGRFILNQSRQIIPCEDLFEWGKWLETADRHVAQTELKDRKIKISTVFLGLDHSFGSGEPLLFETMIFGGMHDGHQTRCSTWEQAEIMHKEAVELATWGRDE